MNARNTCPDIPDTWKGSMTDVCRVLGGDKPVSSKTVRKYIASGKIKARRGSNGRLQLLGRDVKRLWCLL